MAGFIGTGLPRTIEDKNVGWVFIKAQKVTSGVSTVQFQDGTNDVVMDSTYDEYMFIFTSMHPQNNNVQFAFQVNGSGESGYNEAIGSVHWNHYDGASKTATLNYEDGNDSGGGATAYQNILSRRTGNETKESVSGDLHLFEPANAGKVTHFISKGHGYHNEDYALSSRVTGYFDTTAAIDEISFAFDSGNIDAGTISMFGLAKS